MARARFRDTRPLWQQLAGRRLGDETVRQMVQQGFGRSQIERAANQGLGPQDLAREQRGNIGGAPAPPLLSPGAPAGGGAPTGGIPSVGGFPDTSGTIGGGMAGGAREEQILGGFSDLQQQLLGQIDQLGGAARQRIDEDFAASQGSALADIQARGLGSSSFNPLVRQRVTEGREQALQGLDESLARQRLGVIGDVGQASLGFQGGVFSDLLAQGGRERLANIANAGQIQRMQLQRQLGGPTTTFGPATISPFGEQLGFQPRSPFTISF